MSAFHAGVAMGVLMGTVIGLFIPIVYEEVARMIRNIRYAWIRFRVARSRETVTRGLADRIARYGK